MYTDAKHNLDGPKSNHHVLRTMTRHLVNTCWDGASPKMPGEQPTEVVDE